MVSVGTLVSAGTKDFIKDSDDVAAIEGCRTTSEEEKSIPSLAKKKAQGLKP
jgi:hypothetical protein